VGTVEVCMAMKRARSGLMFVAGFLAGVLFVGFARPAQAPSPVDSPNVPLSQLPQRDAHTDAETPPAVVIAPRPQPQKILPSPRVDARAIPEAPASKDDEWRNDGYDDAAESPSGRGYPMIGGPELGKPGLDVRPKRKSPRSKD